MGTNHWRMALTQLQCMEKGLKNLQQAHRSAQRKERGIYEGDSGIGCSDAENELDEGHPDAAQSVEQAQGGYSIQRGGPSIQSMLSLSPAYPQQP